jgi:hypothetical protein
MKTLAAASCVAGQRADCLRLYCQGSPGMTWFAFGLNNFVIVL